MTKTILDLPVDDIVIDEDLDFRTTGTDVADMAASIETYGLMQPITVVPNGDGAYHVIAGRRRLRAVRHLGHDTIEAIVREDMTNLEGQLVGQIIENLHREDISAMDEARAFSKLGSFDLKQSQISDMVGCSSSHVSARLALLKLPPTLVKRIERGSLPQALGVKIARLPKAVRDVIAQQHTITENSIAVAETDYRHAKDRDTKAKELSDKLKVDLPIGASDSSWGYHSPDAIAEMLDVADQLPEDHAWGTERFDIAVPHEAPKDFKAALVDLQARGVLVSGAPGHYKVTILYPYDEQRQLAARKAEAEQLAATREAQENAKREQMDRVLLPLIAQPPRSEIIGWILFTHVHRMFAFQSEQSALTRRVAHRLELEGDDLVDQIIEWGTTNTANACRVLLAAIEDPFDSMFLSLDGLDQIDMTEEMKPKRDRLLKAGELTVEQLPESWRDDLPELETPEETYERMLAEEIERREDDDLSEDELDEIRSEIAAYVGIEVPSAAEDQGEEE